jgi:tRNA-2-methylthio-N6-dimethylallyladenosine synthase
MNESDSERIAAFLEKQGYKSTIKMEDANLIVVNACSVRQTAIDRIFGLKKKFLKLKTQNSKLKTILTGCVIKSDFPKFKEFFDEILTINQFLGKNYLEMKPNYLYSQSAFVPIMTGCNNFCSYCVVPHTRGREISRSIKEVIAEVKNLIKKGYKEITLLGQNVNSYLPADEAGKYSFAKLLEKINDLPGDFQIKFLTSHPKDMSEELIKTIAKCKKISKEIHLPIQSGDNEILRKMNRGYTVEQYKNLIEKIRTKIPRAEITTDVIVGFPEETKKQFENTVKIFEEIKFAKAYVNKYSTRAGTPASYFKDDVPLEEKKRRWAILNKIANPPTPKASADKPKLIVVLGPTASGKSDLAIKIAKNINGEIISADSRQVYKKMDIGTGKIMKKEMRGIPHYMLDIVSPQKQITVAEYRKLALEAMDKIFKKGKTPIICGGTGFYIRALVEGLDIPKVEPDWKLRKELENKSIEELFKQLKKLDPQRAKNIDSKNRRRLIRAIEIIKKTGKPVPLLKFSAQGGPACLAGRRASGWDALYIGIKKSPLELKNSINKRIDKMMKNGLMKEANSLIKKYGQTIVLKNTIGYKEWLKNPPQATHAGGPVKMRKALLSGTAGQIKLHTLQFAKRQMTWFNKYPGKKIHWVSSFTQAEKLVKNFLLLLLS